MLRLKFIYIGKGASKQGFLCNWNHEFILTIEAYYTDRKCSGGLDGHCFIIYLNIMLVIIYMTMRMLDPPANVMHVKLILSPYARMAPTKSDE